MPRQSKSFYDLAFGVDPGGARKDSHFVRGTLDEIKADLANELADQLNLYLLCWYGAELQLNLFEDGVVARSFDLHPVITIRIEGYPTITFDDSGTATGYSFEDEDEDEENGLTSKLFANALEGVSVSVDWAKLEVPALRGVVVREGDFVSVDGDWLDDDDDLDPDELRDNGYLPYGHTDREA